MKLTGKQRRAIEVQVKDLYDSLKANLLGRFFKGPQVWMEVARAASPSKSIEGLFRYALHLMYGPDAEVPEQRLRQLASITANYLDAEKLRAVNQVIAEVEQSGSIKDLKVKLEEFFDKATSKVTATVVTEARNASNFAEREGIMQVASDLGEADPTVARLGPMDAKTCKVCRKLWHDDKNPMIPKVYKSSEIMEGYTSHRDPKPTWNATHPHCRHVWIMVPPNYGFDDSGRLKFVAFGHDEFKARRGTVKKSEQLDVQLEPCWGCDACA